MKRRGWEKASIKAKRNVAPIGWPRKGKSWKLRGKKRNRGRGGKSGGVPRRNSVGKRRGCECIGGIAGEGEEDGANGRAIGPARLMTRGIKQYWLVVQCGWDYGVDRSWGRRGWTTVHCARCVRSNFSSSLAALSLSISISLCVLSFLLSFLFLSALTDLSVPFPLPFRSSLRSSFFLFFPETPDNYCRLLVCNSLDAQFYYRFPPTCTLPTSLQPFLLKELRSCSLGYRAYGSFHFLFRQFSVAFSRDRGKFRILWYICVGTFHYI